MMAAMEAKLGSKRMAEAAGLTTGPSSVDTQPEPAKRRQPEVCLPSSKAYTRPNPVLLSWPKPRTHREPEGQCRELERFWDIWVADIRPCTLDDGTYCLDGSRAGWKHDDPKYDNSSYYSRDLPLFAEVAQRGKGGKEQAVLDALKSMFRADKKIQ